MAIKERESTDYLPNLDDGEQPLSYKNFRMKAVDQPIATVGDREFKNTVEMEAFLQEEVMLRIHPTNDVNAPPFVPVGCNGDQVWLPRGKAISIPRKFIESLARYEAALTTEQQQDPNADNGYLQRTRASQPYPFAIIQDRHPKGRAWLERIMRGG